MRLLRYGGARAHAGTVRREEQAMTLPVKIKPISVKALIRSRFIRDLPLVTVGCAIAALAVDMFMVPNGLAAGGLTGLATITSELASRAGFSLPIGLQTIVINALLLVLVARTGGARYVLQTVTGFALYGFFTDLFAPFVVPLDHNDLTLPTLWGGIISGLGYGLVFRCGVNTGGSDTIAQIISRKTGLPVGSTVMVIDVAICAASAPVFSITNALYTALAMVLMGYVVDIVVDGGVKQRAAFIISERLDEISKDILTGMERGATRIEARGEWTGEERPMLFVLVDKREVPILKAIVAQHDRQAIMVITDVNEVLGEGFNELRIEH